jgi:hypothetical protein
LGAALSAAAIIMLLVAGDLVAPPDWLLPVYSRVQYDSDLKPSYRYVTMRIDNIETSELSSHRFPGRWLPLIIYVALISIMSAALYGLTLLQN